MSRRPSASSAPRCGVRPGRGWRLLADRRAPSAVLAAACSSGCDGPVPRPLPTPSPDCPGDLPSGLSRGSGRGRRRGYGLRLMRRRLVLFVRAPQLGVGKRRLARAIGDVATLRFERLMIALLLRRLAADRRWRLRIAVTPDTARRHARHWRRGVEATGQGGGDLGTRMRRALASCPPGPVVLVGGDIPALDARHVAAAFRHARRLRPRFRPGPGWRVLARRRPPLPGCLPPLFERVRWSSPYALADTLAGLSPTGYGRFCRSPRRRRRRRGLSPAHAAPRFLSYPSGAPAAAASARRNCTGGSGCRAGGRGCPPRRRGRRWASRAARRDKCRRRPRPSPGSGSSRCRPCRS